MQIQTVKTQEMNLLREQQEALTVELQQRRVEYESLLAQRDDLDSQLQVTEGCFICGFITADMRGVDSTSALVPDLGSRSRVPI